MSKGKKKKKKKVMPPLGWQDRCIYILGYLLILAVLAGLVGAWMIVRHRVAWSDPAVRAVYRDGSFLLAVPFILCLAVTLGGSWSSLEYSRYPFFGKKGVTYGPPQYPNTLPLFMKNKPDYWQSPSARAMRRSTVVFLLCLNLILFLMVPFSLTGRTALYEDGSAVVYGNMGQEREHYGQRDVEEVKLDTYTTTRRHGRGFWSYRTNNWHIRLELTMADGEKLTFSEGDFSGEIFEPYADLLERFQQALDEYPDYKVVIEDADQGEEIVRNWELNYETARQLYRLFGLTE